MTTDNQEVAAITNPSEILGLLGSPRLSPYKQNFKPKTDEELLGAYQWAQAVSASLHPLLGLVEVVLRNAIHESLSLQCSAKASNSFPWYDRAENRSIVLRGKSLAKIEDLLCEGTPQLRKQIQPTPDLVVSRLSFGFWPNVLEELGNRHAPRTFTDVFPFYPHSKPTHWSYEPNKNKVVMRLKRFQDLRNRVCHFEAVWKPHWVGAKSTHWSHGVQGLKSFHDGIVELLAWCSQDAAQYYCGSFGCNWFSQLCTTNAVMAFMQHGEQQAFLKTFSSPE